MFVVPFRPDGKTRLDSPELALAMFLDVQAACAELGPVVVADALGGQGQAVGLALAGLEGPVTIVNADLPCVTPDELAALGAAAPALAAAADGTTNALALADAAAFRPLYGPNSAARFGLRALDLPGLRDDVDTWDDLMRVSDRVGRHTRAALAQLAAA
jgi:2-phospho-L-lactate guanylyltransferase (CobY/MobA/RfbA family)